VRSTLTATIALLLLAAMADADPLELFWRAETEALQAAGSHAPPAILGAARADYPTSLAGRAATIEVQARVTEPLVQRRGRRERGWVATDAREMRLAIPIGEDSPWAIGWRVHDRSERYYHRLRRDDTALQAEIDERTTAVAWHEGRWTAGLARTQSGFRGHFTGTNVADLQDVRQGAEGVTVDTGGALDTLSIEHRSGGWRIGAQVSDRDALLRIPVEADERQYLGIVHADEDRFEAWLLREDGPRRWFAYASDHAIDPGPSGIIAGSAVRGRMGASTEASAFGVGLRRDLPCASEHLELAHHEQALDLSGWLDRGALGGGMTGRYRADSRVDAGIWALRWARTIHRDRWSLTWGASLLRTDLDFYGRYVDAPGPLRRPEHHWEQRLIDGELWLAGLALGASYRTANWQLSGDGLVIGGDISADFEDLVPKEPVTRPQAVFPSARQTGPGTRLHPGWAISVSISRSL